MASTTTTPLLTLTRGPWSALRGSNGFLYIRDENGNEIARIRGGDGTLGVPDDVRAMAEIPALFDLMQTVRAGEPDAARAKADLIAQRISAA